MSVPDALEWYAKQIGNDLREARFMALSNGLGAGRQRDRIVLPEGQFDLYLWRAASTLDVVSKPKTA